MVSDQCRAGVHDRERILRVLGHLSPELRAIGLVILGADGLLADRRIDGDIQHGLGHLLGVGAARLGDRRGQDLHADIAGDRPGGGVLLLRVGTQPRDVLLVRGWSVPVESVVGVRPDAERIVVAHGLGGFDRPSFARAKEVAVERLEIFSALACLAKVTKWPPHRLLNTASGFLDNWALMKGE